MNEFSSRMHISKEGHFPVPIEYADHFCLLKDGKKIQCGDKSKRKTFYCIFQRFLVIDDELEQKEIIDDGLVIDDELEQKEIIDDGLVIDDELEQKEIIDDGLEGKEIQPGDEGERKIFCCIFQPIFFS